MRIIRIIRIMTFFGPDHHISTTMQSKQAILQDVETPQTTPTSSPRSDPSCFELLNRLRRQLIVARTHIIAHTTLALKDEAGNYTWVEFEPKFRSHLFKCAFSLLGELITPAAQRMHKKAIFVYILEILNQEGEDTLFTSKHGHEKTARANRKRKQTPAPSEPAPQANARECQEDEAKTDHQVKAPTPKENPPAPPEDDTAMAQQPPSTSTPADPAPAGYDEYTSITPTGAYMHWWKKANPGDTLRCEGTRNCPCNKPATHIKTRGNFETARYPKCDFHAQYGHHFPPA